MDDVDLSDPTATADDASAYIDTQVDGGSLSLSSSAAADANTQIQSALGFAQRGVNAVSGVLGNFGISLGGVGSPTAVTTRPPAGSPPPVQVGSTQQSTSGSTVMYLILAAIALVVLVVIFG